MKFTFPFNLTLVWAEWIHGLSGAGVWRLTFLKGGRHVEVSGELLVDVVVVAGGDEPRGGASIDGLHAVAC